MNEISQALSRVQQRIQSAARRVNRDPQEIQLLAVSKTKPVNAIQAAYAAGQRAFGENYLQDALPKIAELQNRDIEWHYIGRIQSNKTREIAEHFAWVHGIDKFKHAQRLSQHRPPQLVPLQCCIQVNLSGEASKGGVAPDQLKELAEQIASLPHLRLRGLMTMPNPDSPPEVQQSVFQALASLRDDLNTRGMQLDTLSMGMSGDLELAIGAGSTLVRIGTDIFGSRAQKN